MKQFQDKVIRVSGLSCPPETSGGRAAAVIGVILLACLVVVPLVGLVVFNVMMTIEVLSGK